MTDPGAPTPLPVPRQRASSALSVSDADAGTRDVEPGPPPAEDAAAQAETSEPGPHGDRFADHVKHIHLADRGYHHPVSIAGELYLDGERVYQDRVGWSVTGGTLQETLLTLRVPRAAVTVTEKNTAGNFKTRLFGRLVLITDTVPFPDLLGDPHDLIDITLVVGELTVGPRPVAE